MFTKAIVRKPCKNIINGITSASLGKPDYQNALKQHDGYVEALKRCGLQVTVLNGDENYPDSVFVEDTALITPKCAILANPGTEKRNGEKAEIEIALKNFFPELQYIVSPGFVDGGDVMMVGDHFYIGLSKRTNKEGANQLVTILKRHGLTGSTVALKSVLHLKTGVNYIEKDNMLAFGEFLTKQEFGKFNILEIPQEESYAANSLWINGKVLVPKGFPKTLSIIKRVGYETIEVDVSEFRKLDGGLSCLSLRF
ncbi:MAG: N(G),N(G)-dimethylarginine dimethylaminohydrolase [Bacteroidales bacterium]|nr:MAG: N(G),N(G)-dimethylarginine dimethylaminohydrolase [Bacteroidales bacterium]